MVSKTQALNNVNIFTPLSNFDLLDAVKKIRIKHFRGVFMQDQLPQQPTSTETGIINLDNRNSPGTHLVAYAIDPRGIDYFDSYSLAPSVEFLRYANKIQNIPVWQSTLPTQTLTDLPICGKDVLNVLDAISKLPKIRPYKVVHEYATFKNSNNK